MTAEKIAILGAGRVGCSLFHALSNAGTTPELLWTRSSSTAQSASAEGFPVASGPALPDLSGMSLVILAVSDGAVASISAELSDARAVHANAVVAHVAGALDLSPLARFTASGIATGSLHPLVSIATRRTPLGGATAAVASSYPAADSALSALATRLGLAVIRPTGDRALYHAAASLVGNFPQVLLEAASRLFASAGLPAETARTALGALLEGAARNAGALGPAKGLTGPIVRGDVEIVRRHLAAIAALRPASDVADLYRAAGRIAVDLARQRSAPGLDELTALLQEK